MSRIVRTVDPVESLIVGTIGQPGEREFFLQAIAPQSIYSFALDKSQVAALADRILEIIKELKIIENSNVKEFNAKLELPLDTEFQIGAIGIYWDGATEKFQIEVQEIVEGDNDLVAEIEEGPALYKLVMAPLTAFNFAKLARRVVAAGRMPCPFCGLPVNKDGHLCPRANGYRR